MMDWIIKMELEGMTLSRLCWVEVVEGVMERMRVMAI
jgi:hypothetical protein